MTTVTKEAQLNNPFNAPAEAEKPHSQNLQTKIEEHDRPRLRRDDYGGSGPRPIPVRRRPLRNQAEQACYEALLRQGLVPTKRGYADFWYLDEGGNLSFVEVKPDGLTLSGAQWAFFAAAARAGIRVQTFRPGEGFRNVTRMLGGTEAVRRAVSTDPSVLRMGGNCSVCQDYLPPGTPMKDLLYCPVHFFRHRGCPVPAGVSPPRPPRESRERRRRSCTCTARTPTRARALKLELQVLRGGTHLEFEVETDGAQGSGRMVWWVAGKEVTRPEAREIVQQLGFDLEGP